MGISVLSVFYAVLCMTVVHGDMHTHTYEQFLRYDTMRLTILIYDTIAYINMRPKAGE